MAQKFGNARWVKEGYFDNRKADLVVGQVTFAVLGPVDFCLAGTLTGEIAGKVIQFSNPKFLDDPRAGESLDDFSIPQIGKVSLLSFDPHPLLSPQNQMTHGSWPSRSGLSSLKRHSVFKKP